MFQNPLACGRPLTIYHGGKPLNGTVQLDGAKHMFAHISACAALAQHVTFEHVPNNLDAVAMRTAMQFLFKKVHVDLERNFLELSDPQNQKEIYIPYELATLSRSLFGLMPALLQRTHRLIFATLPTGCSIGPRPFHWYFDIMRQFGVHIRETNGQIELFKEHLHPTHIHFAKPSMTGSVIAIAMAMSVPGRSMITNVSEETSVQEMLLFARHMGAQICLDGTNVVIESNACYENIQAIIKPDRIHAVTYITAGLMTNGNVTVTGHAPLQLNTFISFLQSIGANFSYDETSITVRPLEQDLLLRPTDVIAGSEPKFSSDWAPFVVLLLAVRSHGLSHIMDDVFSDRFQFIEQLRQRGIKNIFLHKDSVGTLQALIHGKLQTHLLGGQTVPAPDIRGSAALLLAGLLTESPLTLTDDLQIQRGYGDIRQDLQSLGASFIE